MQEHRGRKHEILSSLDIGETSEARNERVQSWG